MYEILSVNRNRQKDYNIETYVEKENLERAIREGIAYTAKNVEDNIFLLKEFEKMDYKNAEAVLIREKDNKENSILIIIGVDYMYEKTLIQGL